MFITQTKVFIYTYSYLNSCRIIFSRFSAVCCDKLLKNASWFSSSACASPLSCMICVAENFVFQAGPERWQMPLVYCQCSKAMGLSFLLRGFISCVRFSKDIWIFLQGIFFTRHYVLLTMSKLNDVFLIVTQVIFSYHGHTEVILKIQRKFGGHGFDSHKVRLGKVRSHNTMLLITLGLCCDVCYVLFFFLRKYYN